MPLGLLAGSPTGAAAVPLCPEAKPEPRRLGKRGQHKLNTAMPALQGPQRAWYKLVVSR